MWKILAFVFVFNSVQSSNSQRTQIFNDKTVEHLINRQKEWSKILSKIPDAAWIVSRSKNPGIDLKNDYGTTFDMDYLLFNLSTKNNSKEINNNITDRFRRIDATSLKCYRDLVYMQLNFYEGWALEMLDAAGKFPSGLLKGNLNWVGDFAECREVTVPLQVTEGIPFGDFKGKYCSITYGIGSKQQNALLGINLGICVPDSCNEEILSNNSNILMKLLENVPLVKQIENYANNTQISCQDSKRKWETSHIVYMCILAVFAIFIVAGTLCDIVMIWKKKKAAKTEEEKSNENSNSRESDRRSVTNDDNEVVINSETSDTEVLILQKKKSESAIVQFLICFSLYTNGAKILNTENTSGQLQCIHGIRFLSMFWVIMGHSFISVIAFMENPFDFLNYFKKFSALFLIQATFSVDTFFLLSGLLLSYLFLKNYKGSDKKVNWVYYYLHRIWRLTPALMMVLGFYTTIWLHMGSGPLWPKETESGNCKNYWWRNLLYIQNFEDASEMCMAWTWYLANDMQFYIISPLFLILLWKFPIAGFVVTYGALGISIITTGILGTKNNLFSIYSQLDVDDSGGLNLTGNFFDDIYDKPYCRIGPYLIGIITGYALIKTDEWKPFFTKKILILCWIVALGLSSSVFFGIYHTHLGIVVASVYVAFSRTVWSMAVAWMIFACLAGFGGIINTILSWKAWIPLSRLTYSAYLIHPVILGGFCSSLIKPYYFRMNSMIVLFFGFLVASYMAAFVVSIAFESSMMAVEKFILTRFSKK